MRARSGADAVEYRRPKNEEIPTSKHDHITLKLTGARAAAGIELGALDGFLTHFLAVLRDYDRHVRGEDLRKSGSPEAKAAAAVALRLVSLRPGSAIAELEPVISQHQPYAGFDLGDAPRAVQVVDDLLDHVVRRDPLPSEITDSLEAARRACGEDGAFELSTDPRGRSHRTVIVDASTISGLVAATAPRPGVTSITGRLTRLGESPDRVLVRAPDGTEWTCTYDEVLADALGRLWRRNVHALGEGRRSTSRRGTFIMAAVEPLLDDAQTEMFTETHIDTDVLLAEQGLDAPQGLDGVAAESLFDEDVEEAYVAAVFGDQAP